MRKLAFLIIASVFLSNCSEITGPNLETNNNQNSKEEYSSESSKQSKVETNTDLWVGAYMASWNHYVEPTGNWGNLPTEEIDWDAFTHLYYFAFSAKADGSLSAVAAYENLSPERINSIITAGHENGKPVMFSIGGWGNYDGFSSAIKPANRATFVANIVNIMVQWGFDGVDIDMEPIQSGDVDNYIAFIDELNLALETIDVPLASEPLVSVVTNWHPELFGQIHDKVDHVNLMTYDFSGAWEGWVSWHNAAVYSGGLTFPGMSKPLPSIDEKVKAFIAAGVPASKIGIGIDFYGYVWSGGTGTNTGGVTSPNQAWDTAPTVQDNVPYHKIMNDYYHADNYRWDDQALGAYLSIDQSGSSNDKFISYDDEKSIQAKFDYAREKGLGGTIIWELSGGYRKDQPEGQRDNLLQAVKVAMNNGSTTPTEPEKDITAPTVNVTAPADGSTVSGIIDINIEAIDNTDVSNVELFINGESVHNFSFDPYIYSWDTNTSSSNLLSSTDLSTSELKAVASDAAGNTSTSVINVTVDNSTPDEGNDNPEEDNTDDGATDTVVSDVIFGDELNSPWINASWSTIVDFNSNEKVKSGNKSIKIEQNRWGGFSLHSGSWGSPQEIISSDHEFVEFSVFAQDQQSSFNVMLQNDSGQSFPKVSIGEIAAGKWTLMQIPVSELNPNNHAVHRISIMEISGDTRTYYIDNFNLLGSGTNGSVDDSEPEPAPTSYQEVYTDDLISPWINTSWNASIDYQNTEKVQSGTRAIKVVQNKWGSLSMHSGSWSNAQNVNPSEYSAIEFAVYSTSSENSFSVMLENDEGQSFPKVKHGSIPANQWVIISIPMSELNPNNNTIHRIDLLEGSGVQKTYYVDNLRFKKSTNS
ncbi:MAG: hypothetical protein HUJ22_02495 [Gracilimonas sp.]|uniref:glycosyl hydrolase family 18 protein n=1 Tax=Gracilimonas sp. TaxID=1974203 RepID=UPI0019C68228|nr:glycosyl hydrolase family 18 protein [Gracilimonas sp.]MBD3615414.1 hypothetical protein [Gracilimonas sp.]